ncbi:AAA family ATPase [Actinotalea solisilvae]|uniref:AAA family ATPase n=1 Tax=Actinotalea solisilvae TaxID=2072922 RepID=UPI0018F12533|nr:AAA family ATPase [Actinotalea solisilvae]
MHLHTLTIQALGPFPGRHTVDLGALGASGIFLLEGPTGAGKSTLIDAIVFALYGKVASKEATEERLRSAHAAPGDETVVDLVFETGAGVHRVRRTPAYPRPKQRGTGTTTQQATVKLWRLTDPSRPDDGELLSTRLDEAGLELQRLVGLDRTQFVQTVVLPQGEFAGFLRANPEDRRGLLQKVFGTEVYDRLQQRLEAMRAETGRALTDAGAAVARAVDHFAGAAGLDDDDAGALRGLGTRAEAGDALREAARTRAAAHEQEALATARAAAAARERCGQARTALDAARALVAADRRRTALRAELADLESQADEHAARAERLAAARRAVAVLPSLSGAEAAARALDARAAACDAVVRAVPADVRALVDETTEPRVVRKTLAIERDRCAALRGTLVRAVALEDELPVRRQQLRTQEAAQARRAGEVAALTEALAERPAARVPLADAVTVTAAAAAGLAAARERLAAVRTRWSAVEEAERLTGEVEEAQGRVRVTARQAEDAVAAAARLQRARIAGMAGELAADLVPGEACVVCGGTEHPAPALLTATHVTVEALEAAEDARDLATDRLGAASTALAALTTRLDERRAAAGGTADEVRTLLDAARGEVATAEAARGRLAELEDTLRAFDDATASATAAVARLEVEIAEGQARATALEERLLLDEVEVEGARDGADTVRTRLDAVEVRMRHLEAWTEALAALEEATSTHEGRVAELASALVEHDFADGAAVRAAALEPRALTTLEREVAAHDAAWVRVRAGLAEPDLVALPAVVDVDLDALGAAHASAEEAAGVAAGEAARTAHLAQAAARALTALEAAVDARDAAHAEAGPVVRMADVAAASGADNTKQLTLATYVLARRFEDVVAAANTRLAAMSDGRYALVRSEEKEAVRSRRTGLAMKVVDHRTGTERDPRTLSGGETFYVSLCLALGLADVVTAEAGGTDLGTLFIDEGFGSLDPETLEVVLAELARLRDGGRVVGVVSHVEALKQAIAERIEVRCRPDGTSTLSVRA